MHIIKPSQHVTVNRYALDYQDNKEAGCGFSFPCSKEGHLLQNELTQTGRDNFLKCVNGEYEVTFKGVKDYSYVYYEPAIGLCACGKRVTLEDSFINECSCGLTYNMSGQLLAPRSQWEETIEPEDYY